jgi:hypothetical protein
VLSACADEEAFWTLRHICVELGQGALWAPSMLGWIEYGTKLDLLVKAKLPKLHAHMAEQGLTVDLYALPWFMTLYTKNFPFEATLRVLDVYLCEPHPKGSKILFRVALAILADGERELLRMHDAVQLAEHIRQLPFTSEGLKGDKLVDKALAISLKTKALFPQPTAKRRDGDQ